MGVVVYTAVFGGYDVLRPVADEHGHFGTRPVHVCFTDHVQRVAGWAFVEDDWRTDSPRRAARMRKTLSHRFLPDTVYSVWIDGNMELLVDPYILIDDYLMDVDMAVFSHPVRHCAYQEAAFCAQIGRDNRQVLEEQMQKYREEGFPAYSGLTETGMLVRRHTTQIRKFNEAWWAEIEHHSVRDQVSFVYAAWKTNTNFQVIPGRSGENEYAKWRPHRRVKDVVTPDHGSELEEIPGPRLRERDEENGGEGHPQFPEGDSP